MAERRGKHRDPTDPHLWAAVDAHGTTFLAAIVENLGQPVFVKDRESRFVLVNRACAELVGIERSRMIGGTDHDFFPHEQADFFVEKDREVFLRGEPITVEEAPLTDASGHRHVLRTVKAPVRDATGAVSHVVGIMTDITIERESEERLRLANEELERRVEERTEALRSAQQALLRKERLAVLGQLAGGLAHQIRNPLAAIQNAAAVLKRKLGQTVDPDVSASLAVIREEVWEANRIITDLLDYARIKPPHRALVDVGELLEAALARARPPDDVQVVREIEPALMVSVDERQLRDALGNVMRNALEAMHGGGKLFLQALREGDTAVIAIEDTGPGLSRASLQYLFEPLVTSKQLGLGLGLPTAKALVENQGGTIRCATHRGTGARFEIRIPVGSD